MQSNLSQDKYLFDIVQMDVSRRSYSGLALMQSDKLKPILQVLNASSFKDIDEAKGSLTDFSASYQAAMAKLETNYQIGC